MLEKVMAIVPSSNQRLKKLHLLLKVRQMFDERRQTTVKGIDRSYPLEPLENKPRKQANGNSVQKNGNLTVNRQSVTVRRVARADVNSNLNGGKPVVSYHEEITRESFGPSARQHQGDDEFGNENHVGRYTNGNHRNGVTRHFPSDGLFTVGVGLLLPRVRHVHASRTRIQSCRYFYRA